MSQKLSLLELSGMSSIISSKMSQKLNLLELSVMSSIISSKMSQKLSAGIIRSVKYYII